MIDRSEAILEKLVFEYTDNQRLQKKLIHDRPLIYRIQDRNKKDWIMVDYQYKMPYNQAEYQELAKKSMTEAVYCGMFKH